MTRRDAFALAMKVVGVIWIVRALHAVPDVLHFMVSLGGFAAGADRLWSGVLYSVWFAVGLGLGWLLIARADALAGRLVREEGPLLGEGETPGERTVLAVGTRLVGLVFTALALPRIVLAFRDVVQYQLLAADPRYRELLAGRPFSPWDSFVWPVATLLLGLGLLLGGAVLARLLAGPDAGVPPPAGEVAE